MNKRYFIFAWNDRMAAGGINECIGITETLEEARKIFNKDKSYNF